jgi:hypothetical protein
MTKSIAKYYVLMGSKVDVIMGCKNRGTWKEIGFYKYIWYYITGYEVKRTPNNRMEK